jgi:hypothetical protein
MPYDNKYGQVTTEFGDIPDDEPVVVFRGRDRHLPELLKKYHSMCIDDSPSHHLEAIYEAATVVSGWQRDNADRVVTPTSDAYYQRKGHIL